VDEDDPASSERIRLFDVSAIIRRELKVSQETAPGELNAEVVPTPLEKVATPDPAKVLTALLTMARERMTWFRVSET